MSKYSSGKIYTVRCKTDESLINVGSTIETRLSARFCKHKGQPYCSLCTSGNLNDVSGNINDQINDFSGNINNHINDISGNINDLWDKVNDLSDNLTQLKGNDTGQNSTISV
jgi:hypothetical protein